ncbi:hypothetical protein SERLA73DRAFT_182823 [Serpula lacrymans var. lacrymans S7.3]|uniref:F-box domain-containing protein n=2 Tax=Serpula lacrymans var. lacrymans TaxID=341189 RepID=F8Q123_SERL3|nr:hypothetical protein SERLA73DRAFT_182823 [Serpula lacrymans var. lacrymans S7.3]
MLKGSPNLETLTLSQSGPAGAPTDWHSERPGDGLSDILELPIKTLVLSWLKPEYVGPLMRRIALPQLTSLTLEFDDADYTEFVRQLTGPATGVSNQNVLGNQAPIQSLLMRLEDFKIASLPCDLQCIDLIYSQLVDLKHLSLACNFVDELFFKKLTNPISGASNAPVAITPDLTAVATEPLFYLPQLISLRTSGISGPVMRDAVLARKAAGIPLRAVYMDEEDEVTDTQAQWFRRNLETFERFEASDEEDDDDIFDEDSDDGMQEDDPDDSMVQ